MRKIVNISWFVLACGLLATVQADTSSETLRQYADPKGFWIGNLIQRKYWNQDPSYKPTVAKEFNSLVSIIFWRFTEPEQGKFTFRAMDGDMQFAQTHNIKLFGAALIYRPEQAVPWLMGHSAEELDAILKNHVTTVVQHGGDTYYAWEVVNEPLDSVNNRPWANVLGRQMYIAKAFQYAREANPHARLVLNETMGTGGIRRDKTDRFIALIKKVKSLAGPIDVAGIEMHLVARDLHPDYLDDFRYFLDQARQAGVEVYVTEMDVYQTGVEDPWNRQKQIFHDILSTCLADSNCKGFTSWGVSDKHTWLRTRPYNRFPDAKPLMFDETYQKKPAYDGVLDALREASKSQAQ